MSGSKVKKSAGSINSLACFNEWDTAGAKRLKYPAREARQTSSGRLRACPGVVYLFDRLKLSDRIITSIGDLNRIKNEIDYKKTDRIICNERDNTNRYLTKWVK